MSLIDAQGVGNRTPTPGSLGAQCFQGSRAVFQSLPRPSFTGPSPRQNAGTAGTAPRRGAHLHREPLCLTGRIVENGGCSPLAVGPHR